LKRGGDEVYDANMKNGDVKRFCTLNLFGSMELDPLLDLIPIPHLVFRASKTQIANEWFDQEERAQWDTRVLVSFHPNAWVDAETHKIRLKGVLGPINNNLVILGAGLKGVVFEDNLSIHGTESVFDSWDMDLPHFTYPVFVPPNMTDIIQVIDRHIGV